MHLTRAFRPGDLVWFDPGVGYVLPGEVVEFHRAAQVITVQAVINNVTKTFTLNNLSSVKSREDLGKNKINYLFFSRNQISIYYLANQFHEFFHFFYT